jgi:hypothetical protein
MNKLFAIHCAGLLLGISLAAQADMTMTQVHTTQAMKAGKADGDPKTQTSTLWMAADKLRMDGENESVLLKGGKDSVYLIDNKKKTYTGISLSQIANPSGQSQEMPPEVAAMMGNMMKMEVTIEPTTETKTINTWNCTKYLQTMKMMGTTTTSELWATTDVKVDPGMFTKFSTSVFLKNQSMKNLAAQMQKEYAKIKGFVVYSVSTSTAGGKETRTTSEIREVKESVAPAAGTYEVPAKYKLKPWE